MTVNPGYVAFKLAFQLSPIILTNGIASNVPGGMLPIIAITESINFAAGLLSQGEIEDLDSFFAHYEPLPGATLIENDVGRYPFANQAVAANATIAQPLTVSLLMHCPVREELGYATKLATMMALQQALKQHTALGGTYTVSTPSNFFTDCLLLRLIDASTGGSKQAQNAWRWDFYKPLLTIEQATQAQNSLMSKLTSGSTVNGDATGTISWSGLSSSVGSTNSLAGMSIIPAASAPSGTSVAGLGG